jgi:NDP-sugar pyrophosphorylase family protein
MNSINKQPLSSLGFGFIDPAFIPKGKDEYYLRNRQHRTKTRYRKLTAKEIQILVRNDNSADDWNNLEVSPLFEPKLVKRCSFFGKIRIGKLEPFFHEFNNLRMPVGIYNSTIISCDIGDNVVIDQISFMSHIITGNDVMLVNIKELSSTDHAKFGNGVVKIGEDPSVRIWMELANENGGRKVLPFNGMLAADAWIWSKFRDDKKLLDKFQEFTDDKFDRKRGYYGKIGDRTVIKNCDIIKDAWIGADAYIKGANKLKNITILSTPEASTQIGEGCELVNGIVGYGNRIFYGVKAVRFVMGTNTQLKYGARLINSYLGDNSTISCCEVLNSLIFPGHEQHHNNSFLCAATVQGQSNMAAGATIGSNHNSRAADGELVAGRGFWPGLCVSIKHNSTFASYTLLAKGDFQYELNIPIPFSLVSNSLDNKELHIMPGYWFSYNLYALARNSEKYVDRDRRMDKSIYLEYDFLAPDTINEMTRGLGILESSVGHAFKLRTKKSPTKSSMEVGRNELLAAAKWIEVTSIYLDNIENSKRSVKLLKVQAAYANFRKLISYYCVRELIQLTRANKNYLESLQTLLQKNKNKREEWINAGGQLVRKKALEQLKSLIKIGKIKSWDEVHQWYQQQSKKYKYDKLNHAAAVLLEITRIAPHQLNKKRLIALLEDANETENWIANQITLSRQKDYLNPFRKMLYETDTEMREVIGTLEENPFIQKQNEKRQQFARQIEFIKGLLYNN